MSDRHLVVGRNGEAFVLRYLTGKGYRSVDANWRCPHGELDLVMLDGEDLVFVEVKARSTSLAGAAEESISPAKARKLLIAGETYVSEHPEQAERMWRIDLVAITVDRSGEVNRVTHVQNAVVAG